MDESFSMTANYGVNSSI